MQDISQQHIGHGLAPEQIEIGPVANADDSNALPTAARAVEYLARPTPSNADVVTASMPTQRAESYDPIEAYGRILDAQARRRKMFEEKWWLFKPGQSGNPKGMQKGTLQNKTKMRLYMMTHIVNMKTKEITVIPYSALPKKYLPKAWRKNPPKNLPDGSLIEGIRI